MTKLEKVILKTIAFFDLSQKPVVLDEIWQFLCQVKTSRIKVLISLQKLTQEGRVCKKGELYFLPGREKILKINTNREAIQSSRWKKVEKFAKLFEHAPFVKNVSVVGSLAAGTSTEGSDINLLIVAKRHRVFLAKFFATAILELFAQNKNRWYRANKFSIDYCLDESDLKVKFPAAFLANLVPVLDRGIYKKMIEENAWIYKEFPNWQPKEIKSKPYRHTRFEKILLSDFGKMMIQAGKAAQLKKLLEMMAQKKGLTKR